MKSISLTILGLVVLFPVYFFVVQYLYPDMVSRGQFGDMFGALNALFSGLAFLGVIYAVFLQRKELELQREELKLTREELRRSAKAQEKSEQALSKQAASLKIAAQLNGKSAELQHINTLIEITNSARYGVDHAQFNRYKNDANEIITEIKDLLKGK